MKIKSCKLEYLEKAKLLTEEEPERLISRVSEKLHKRLGKAGLSKYEILGVQLEIEDDQLQEWREKIALIRKSEAKKQKER
jgi:hypothetical protein